MVAFKVRSESPIHDEPKCLCLWTVGASLGTGGEAKLYRKKASHAIASKPGLKTGCCEATVITTFHLGYLHMHTLFCTFLRLYSVVELAWAAWLTDAGSLDFLGLTESVCKYTFSCSCTRRGASPAASNPLFCRKIENTVILISLTLSSLRVYSRNASNIPRIPVAMESQQRTRYILQKLLCRQWAPFTHAQHIQTV